MGLAAMLLTMSGLTTPPADRPKKMSAPTITSANVRAEVGCANWRLSSSISSVRPSYTTPAKSVTQIFSLGKPIFKSKPRQASAAAPAPEVTSLTFLRSLPTTFIPLIKPADTTMAVPCWSS